MAQPPRILYIDAYDSFSNNIISLLSGATGAQVTRIRIDTPVADLAAFLQPFSAVVCGPGPGHPACAKDVGIYRDVWALADDDVLPVLGICLGFQSLVLAHGGVVQRLREPRHGLSTAVTSCGSGIFAGLDSFESVQYHSLEAVVHDDAAAARTPLWAPSRRCPQLEPLAWDLGAAEPGDDTGNPAAILMAARHATRPFWGVQFHPESVCSSSGAAAVVRNWWACASAWHASARGAALPCPPPAADEPASAPRAPASTRPPSSPSAFSRSPSPGSTSPSSAGSECEDSELVFALGGLTVPLVCEALGLGAGEVVVLDSEMRPMDGLGDSSIVGLVEADTLRLTYHVGSAHLVLQHGAAGRVEHVALAPHGGLFGYLKAFMAAHARPAQGTAFAGGLMGYVGYEAGLESIAVPAPAVAGRPDVSFAFVQRSVVLDHRRRAAHVQSIHPADARGGDADWPAKAAAALRAASLRQETQPDPASLAAPRCVFPTEAAYKAKIAAAQEHIRAGDSYELCLTDQTRLTVARGPAWPRYLSMRRRNPAPFGAYVRLGALTLLSTSPERFVRWTAPAPSPGGGTASTAHFRPIKGTVQKRPPGAARAVTHAEAAAVLATPKERAENLMIVDLIRHDLHGVAGPGRVRVPRLMAVEEYETVFQLVSAVEGDLRAGPADGAGGVCGLDALAASLPPGSMTGAPKRRSCELLRGLEAAASRSVYAGVLGYICVSGAGDFSVVIRSAWAWDDEPEEWRIGAGGAVVNLSSLQGEWDEMLAKLRGALNAFAPGAAEGMPA